MEKKPYGDHHDIQGSAAGNLRCERRTSRSQQSWYLTEGWMLGRRASPLGIVQLLHA